MKKLVLLLAVVASATLFSCSGNKAANDSTAAETTAQTEDTTAPADTTAPVDSTVAQA
jgi:outer membrane biogenesis lipoprotein LolB